MHNYGHGGSGWSLSWGSATLALELLARAGRISGKLAVLGCGAIGLTTALTAQRAGFRVTIYAKERSPFVRSSRATGTWSPDSRVALASAAPADFAERWERMTRASFAMHQSYLGVCGNPVEWTDRFVFSDLTLEQVEAKAARQDSHGFATYGDRISDIAQHYHDLDLPFTHVPQPIVRARRATSMTFNIADYSRQLESDFYAGGGTIEKREFLNLRDVTALSEHAIVNCTGYGARKLLSDETLVPIRGQIAWLIPQDDVNFGLNLDGLTVLGRRDGIAVQPVLQGDDTGWNDDDEVVERDAAEAGVTLLRQFVERAASWMSALGST